MQKDREIINIERMKTFCDKVIKKFSFEVIKKNNLIYHLYCVIITISKYKAKITKNKDFIYFK